MLFCYPQGNEVFQQENCISHKSRLVTGWLGEHSSDLHVINWTPRSPDSVELFQKLVESMPRRVVAVIKVRGGPTR
ncbi:transposable element Tcb2 transposase [Trichonephila clavipes]|nr:transposable element Tcb2 transposase [Trichonephila clavipes]